MYLSGNGNGKKVYPPGRPGFVAWLKDRMPGVYETIKQRDPELVKPIALPKRARGRSAAVRRAPYPWRGAEGYNYARGDFRLYGLGQDPADVGTTGATAAAAASKEESWADKISSWVSPLVNVYQQKKMVDLQLERARNNLPPLPDDALAAKVKVTTGFDRYIPWVLAGVGGIVLIKLL